jgi:membrane-associated phospholipid phosphatase
VSRLQSADIEGHVLPCLPSDPPSCTAAAPLLPPAAPPPPAPPARFPTPIDGLGPDLGRAFGGWNLLAYAATIGGSAALAFSGADQSIRNSVQDHIGSKTVGDVTNITGYALPSATAASVWLIGLAAGDRPATGAGSAAVQALAVTTATTFVLKVSVGRGYPPEGAQSFHPFQSWSWPFPAWPSGHTSSTTSVVAALTGYYGKDELWIPFVGYPVALAVGFGMLDGDQHWTSDLLAGAVIGQCIGWSIGRAFRARARGEAPPAVSFVPFAVRSAQGVAIEGTW